MLTTFLLLSFRLPATELRRRESHGQERVLDVLPDAVAVEQDIKVGRLAAARVQMEPSVPRRRPPAGVLADCRGHRGTVYIYVASLFR